MPLPRSSLVKRPLAPVAPAPPVASPAPPVPAPMFAPAIAAPLPFVASPPVVIQTIAPSPTLPDADLEELEDDTAAELVEPALPRPVSASVAEATVEAVAATPEPREPAPSIDVEVEVPSAPNPFVFAPVEPTLHQPLFREPAFREPARSAAPSLLMRLTMPSLLLGTPDPVLVKKMTPEVADRRRRLTRVVKGTIAACAAMCALAVGASILSAGEGSAQAASASPAVVAQGAVHKVVVTRDDLDTSANKLRPRGASFAARGAKGPRAKK